MRHTARLGALAASAILALAAGPAFAGDTEYPTAFTKFKYKLDDGAATFKGEIDSSKGGCIQGRAVKLLRQHNGNRKQVGADHTNNKGKFEMNLGSGPPKDGKYFAQVKKEALNNSSTCNGRTSGSVKVS